MLTRVVTISTCVNPCKWNVLTHLTNSQCQKKKKTKQYQHNHLQPMWRIQCTLSLKKHEYKT